MADDLTAGQIRSLADRLLREGTIGSALVAASGCVEVPIPVQTPAGRFHSWFVPVTSGDLLFGFCQFLPDGTLMRFSSFAQRAGGLAECPPASDWLDLPQIEARAELQRRPDETCGRPFLSFDRTPDRLVWAIPLTTPRGGLRLVFVAGKQVYVPPPEGTYD